MENESEPDMTFRYSGHNKNKTFGTFLVKKLWNVQLISPQIK